MTLFRNARKKLVDRVNQILEYHRIDKKWTDKEDIVAHFTTWDVCVKMLSTAMEAKAAARGGIILWAGDANCLNDPLEGRALIKFGEDPKMREPNRLTLPKVSFGTPLSSPQTVNGKLPAGFWSTVGDIVEKLYEPAKPSAAGWVEPRRLPSSQVYLVSFCIEKDGLDMWRPYADDARGVCMVMPLADAVRLVNGTKWTFYRVMYDPASMQRAWRLLEKPLRETLEAVKGLEDPESQTRARETVVSAISSVLHLYKHPQFQTENEIRLVYHGSRRNAKVEGPRPVMHTEPFFLKAPGCKVILGPKVVDRNRKIATLEIWLHKVFGDKNTPEVQISGVPYQ